MCLQPGHLLHDGRYEIIAELGRGGAVNTRTALTYDATKTMIKAMEMQKKPSREGMQKMLSDPNFMTEGATGTIQFEQKTGDRKKAIPDMI